MARLRTVMVALAVLGTGARRAEAESIESPSAPAAADFIAVHANAGAYWFQGTTSQIMAGPKLTLEYLPSRNGVFGLDVAVGLLSGFCIGRSDEMDCVLLGGYAVEPVVGVHVQALVPTSSVLYGKIVTGGLLVLPDRWSPGLAAVVRGGGGIRHFVSAGTAFELEATAAVGVGGIEVGYQARDRVAFGIDIGMGISIAF